MRRRCGLAVLLPVVVLVGCSHHDSHGAAVNAARVPVMLNDVSVATVLDAIGKAKLPALNPRDTTSTRCPEAGCAVATDTDTVSILKFPSTGRAEIYAAGVPDMVQVEDVVVVFAPTLTREQKTAYGQVVTKAMLTPAPP
ncbi:hypothetical protein MycrhDRAFT_5432 [Mycolicibacterium rhodesiae JS60]|nr:hypothetical protein MycrhDRAFT_5432 [Mycolicibacterium rhodesiae JS60]